MEMPDFNADLLRRLPELDVPQNFALSDWMQEEADERADSRSEQRLVLQQLLECIVVYYRDLAVLAQTGDEERLFNPDLAGMSPGCGADALLERADTVMTAIEHIDSNVNEQLALDHLFTRLAAGS
jgi:hypothetical protein